MLRLIGNAVEGLIKSLQSNAMDSLNIHLNSAMIDANDWRLIAFWVPNPHIALLLIRNNVIFFSQCSSINFMWFTIPFSCLYYSNGFEKTFDSEKSKNYQLLIDLPLNFHAQY